MQEKDALDAAQWLVDHWLMIVMALAGGIGLYFRVPVAIAWGKEQLPKLKGILNFVKPDKVSPKVDEGKVDVVNLLQQMVDSRPGIKDDKFHTQAVEACVSFSEAVIREAGLLKEPEDK